MKIRNGFVSNSSTTSFCIYGIELDIDEEVIKALGIEITPIEGCSHKFDRTTMEYCPQCGEPSYEDFEVREFEDVIVEHFEKMGLDCEYWNGGCNVGEGWFIGKNLEDLKLNKSKDKLGVLKKVEDILKDKFPKENPTFWSDSSTDD